MLRWKTSRISAGRTAEALPRPVAGSEVITAGHHEPVSSGLRPAFKAPVQKEGWNKSKLGSAPSLSPEGENAIRLVAYNPFHDPFGDRVAQAVREPDLAAPEGAPAESKPMVNPLPSPQDKLVPREDEANPKPMPGAAPEATDPYNFRDCNKQDNECALFLETLRGAPLSQISLNILPHYKPDAKSEQEDDADREAQLAQSGPRDWHDFSGRLLATGRLVNLQHGRAVIADEKGNEVARLPMQNLGADEVCFIDAWWRLPPECLARDKRYLPSTRNWVPSTFTWTASALCHKPLYFEQVQLERYGHTAGPFKQPIISGAHFFFTITALPYKMAINPPMECQYALGYYRPGSCAPWHIPPVPLSVRAALAETGAWVGGIYIIP